MAEKYADRAEDFMLFKFGSGLTDEEVVIYDEFSINNKKKIDDKKILDIFMPSVGWRAR